MAIYNLAPNWRTEAEKQYYGKQHTADKIGDTGVWDEFSTLLNNIKTNGEAIVQDSVQLPNIASSALSGVMTTYSLVYSTNSSTGDYWGGVFAANGDIHFVPCSAQRGQKVSRTGTVSTYSLVYTVNSGYAGGVLNSKGEIHFIPYSATVGQKINASGVVSTYSLAYTTTTAYIGGVLSKNDEIFFIPNSATVGQKINASGVVSTFSLVYTTSVAYAGGILDPNGNIHFMTRWAARGQKISSNNTVSTYTLAYTTQTNNYGGVLRADGNIYRFCDGPTAGSGIILKIDKNNSSSTAAFTDSFNNEVNDTAVTYSGGTLGPNGKCVWATQKDDVGGGTNTTFGAVINAAGDVHFIHFYYQNGDCRGRKIRILTDKKFGPGICASPHINKF